MDALLDKNAIPLQIEQSLEGGHPLETVLMTLKE